MSNLWAAVASQPRPVASRETRTHAAIRAARLRRRAKRFPSPGQCAFVAHMGFGWHRDSHGVIQAGAARFPVRLDGVR